MLEKRSSEKEQLDNLNLGGKKLHKTLSGLSVINKLLGNTNSTFEAIKPILKQAVTSLTLIDLGCGSGDNLRKIATWCSSENIRVRLIGIDGNQHILDYALAKNTHEIQVEYVQADILTPDFELPHCDVLMSSHFIYHFSDSELVNFLKTAKQRVRRNIIFSELERNKTAYRLFSIASFLMPFSKIVKRDGKQAIRRAFTKVELISILKKAGVENFDVKEKWAYRLLVAIDC